MKAILVLVAVLFACAFTQENDEELIAALKKVQEGLCKDEESKRYVAKCYNGFPEMVRQALCDCAGPEYRDAEVITVACGVKIESLPRYNEENAKEYKNCVKTKASEMKGDFRSMKRNIYIECMDLQKYVNNNGLKDAMETIKNYVKSRRQ